MKDYTSDHSRDFLLKPQEEILNQITAWLRRHSFSPEDIAKAEEIWVEYIKKAETTGRVAGRGRRRSSIFGENPRA